MNHTSMADTSGRYMVAVAVYGASRYTHSRRRTDLGKVYGATPAD